MYRQVIIAFTPFTPSLLRPFVRGDTSSGAAMVLVYDNSKAGRGMGGQ
jgi:hypothetical protein